MKLMTTLFLSFILLFTSCLNNNTNHKKNDIGNKGPEGQEQKAKENLNITKQGSTFLHTGWYYLTNSGNGVKRQLDKSTEIYLIDPNPIVTAKNFTKLEIYESNAGGQSYVGLSIKFDKEGTESWSIATEKSIGKQLAFILDNKLLEVAKVNGQITAGITALNRGNYSKEDLENFKSTIESEQ